MPARGARSRRRSNHIDGIGWSISRILARTNGFGHFRASPCPPELVDGAENNGRLGNHGKQGLGTDRGSLALRFTGGTARRSHPPPQPRAFSCSLGGWMRISPTHPTLHDLCPPTCPALPRSGNRRRRTTGLFRTTGAFVRSSRPAKIPMSSPCSRGDAIRRYRPNGIQRRQRNCSRCFFTESDWLS